MSNKPPPLKTIKRESLEGSGQMAYVGRAAAFTLSTGTEVIILCRSDRHVQEVLDDLEPYFKNQVTLNTAHTHDAALCPLNALRFDEEL